MKPTTKHQTLISDLRALPKPFWVLFVGTFINRFGTFVMPFLTIYLTRRGHSLIDASWAISSFGFGAVCGSTTGGWLADRIGRRNTIVAGTFAAAVCYMLLHYAVSMPEILVCTWLAGFSAGTYPPASGALLADVVPEQYRVRAYSALRVAMNAGFAAGASTAGFLAKYSFFWLFAGDALTTIVYGFIALFLLPHGLRTARENAPWKEALTHIAGNRAFHAAFCSAFLTALVFSQFGSTFSTYVVSLDLTTAFGPIQLHGETLYGVLLGWNGLLVMICELPMTSLTQKFSARNVMALGYVLIGAGFAMNGIAHTVPMLMLAMTVFTVGEMISMPVSNAYIAQIAPEQMRGRYMGALSTTWSLSSIFGPQLGFRLLAVQPQALWLTCGVLGSAAALVMMRKSSSPELDKPNDAAPKIGAVPAVQD